MHFKTARNKSISKRKLHYIYFKTANALDRYAEFETQRQTERGWNFNDFEMYTLLTAFSTFLWTPACIIHVAINAFWTVTALCGGNNQISPEDNVINIAVVIMCK